MFKRCAGRLLAVAIMGIAGATSAVAQGRVIVFGDSLSDTGNLFAGTGQPPAPYFAGRFSNGPVWVEQLFGPLNRPTVTPTGLTTPLAITGPFTGNINLAFGAARTDNAPNLKAAVSPGIPLQISSFLGGGGDIGANDTVVLWGGANNIFQFFDNTAPALITSTSITQNSIDAASSNITSIGIVAAAKPKTLLVANLPNLGSTPAFNGSTALSLGAFLATEVFNSVQATGVRAIAAANPGVNVIQMDVNAVNRPGFIGGSKDRIDWSYGTQQESKQIFT